MGWLPRELADGAYAQIPAWRGRQHWLDSLTAALDTDDGERVRRALGPARATVLRVAGAEADAATFETGRDVQTSHGRLARALDVSEDTVRLCRRVIRRLGFAVIPEGGGGRQLGPEERAAALARTGRRIYRVAATRALTIPRGHVFSPPSTPSGVGSSSSVRRTHQARPQRARCATSTTNNRTETLRSRRTRHVAAQIAVLLPYLDQPGHHIGQLCDVVDDAFAQFGGLDALPACPDRAPDPDEPTDKGFTAAAWVAEVVKNSIDHWHLTNERTALAMNARDRLAAFAWALKQALDQVTITKLRTGLEHAARRASRPRTTEEGNPTMTSTDTLAPNPPAVLTVYSKPSCVMCNATYRTLDRAGVHYEVIDIAEDAAARDYVKELGHLQAPVVITPDGGHWSGYRPDRIKAFLEHAVVSVG